MVSARKLFAAGGPVLGTLAAAYLHQRGIARFGPALRYHPRVYFRGADTGRDLPRYCPALLAKITDNQGNITGCARAYLDPNTGRIADLSSPKRILDQLHGNAVRFWSASDPVDLIVGEGLENTLSVGTALPEFNLASCLTATHLGLFIPPSGITRIWIARDNDAAGERAAHILSAKLGAVGIECQCVAHKIPLPRQKEGGHSSRNNFLPWPHSPLRCDPKRMRSGRRQPRYRPIQIGSDQTEEQDHAPSRQNQPRRQRPHVRNPRPPRPSWRKAGTR